ncbi:hypothetical protein [Desulfobacula toluolica]|uniref:Uncharacterized protein n=1 Tax=Desulfobacula toluolica (strain DSM 7467 / Tol2) TaxID=651182 RepID=K0NER6_DESTT|nr:hypothetical protein [Desulfobacula toluolica]CCK79430.1 uncharacterized protein TOL2_C12670 [Desulfobacula toluolica Tol2]
MLTGTFEPEKFTGFDIDEFRNEMLGHNLAIKTLGVLMEHADLEVFENGFADASDYRSSLNRIVELYIEKQEGLIDEIVSKFDQSPESIITDAQCEYEGIRYGRFNRSKEETAREIHHAIKKLNAVITAFGDEYPKAKVVRDDFMSLKDLFSKSSPVPEREKEKAADQAETAASKNSVDPQDNSKIVTMPQVVKEQS